MGKGRRKSIQGSATRFDEDADSLLTYVSVARQHLDENHLAWAYDYAIIRLYCVFERLMLEGIVGAINNDTKTFSDTVGVSFPHLTDEACEYLVIGTGYFDFKGRNGLISRLEEFVPEAHYLVAAVKQPKYKTSLERLSALRNYAAHDSYQSKKAALRSVDQKEIGSAGTWLMRQNRFEEIVGRLKELAQELHASAPF